MALKEEDVCYTEIISYDQDGDVFVAANNICLVSSKGGFLPWKRLMEGNGRKIMVCIPIGFPFQRNPALQH